MTNKIDRRTKYNNKLKKTPNNPEHQYVPRNHSKKLVSYGLPEYHKEFNSDLHYGLLLMFYELNADLTEYI